MPCLCLDESLDLPAFRPVRDVTPPTHATKYGERRTHPKSAECPVCGTAAHAQPVAGAFGPNASRHQPVPAAERRARTAARRARADWRFDHWLARHRALMFRLRHPGPVHHPLHHTPREAATCTHRDLLRLAPGARIVVTAVTRARRCANRVAYPHGRATLQPRRVYVVPTEGDPVVVVHGTPRLRLLDEAGDAAGLWLVAASDCAFRCLPQRTP